MRIREISAGFGRVSSFVYSIQLLCGQLSDINSGSLRSLREKIQSLSSVEVEITNHSKMEELLYGVNKGLEIGENLRKRLVLAFSGVSCS